MDKGDWQEIELEQELDQIYRRVAGLATQEDLHKPKETADDLQMFAKDISPPTAGYPVQGRKRAFFRIAPIIWGLLGTAFFLAIIAVLFVPLAVDHYPSSASGVSDGPPAENRPARGRADLKDKDGRRYPIPPEAVTLTIAAAKEPAAASSSFSDKEGGGAGPHAGDASQGHQGRYGVQIRAYPDDQEQNAIAFLEETRRKSPEASLETVTIAGSGVWHRILLGDFSSEEEAGEYRQRRGVARDYPYSFVQKKSGAGPQVAQPAK